jgi:hypothetical protein
MEAAERQQRDVEAAIEALRDRTDGLEDAVCREVARVLALELASLSAAADRACDSLSRLRRTAARRTAWTAGLVAAGCCATAATVVGTVLPSPTEVHALRSERASLEESLRRLRDGGAALDLRRCGAERRWCARVEPGTGRYGRAGDLVVIAEREP